MIKISNNKFQIDSLSKTNVTKQQILEKIQSSTNRQLKAIVPMVDEEIDKNKIIKNAEKMLDENIAPGFSDAITEAIVLSIGRPVFFTKNNNPVLIGNEVDKYKNLINNAIKNFSLTERIKSAGRIETLNLPGYTWVGTGWLITDDLIITNRHVAKTFVEKSGKQFRFSSFLNEPVIPNIDFLSEYDNAGSSEFNIAECVYVAEDNEPDVSVFRVNLKETDGYKPVPIADVDPIEMEDIAVIGYPAFDSRMVRVKDMERIYNGIYDVKRIAPGKISKLFPGNGYAQHDATTLGGNSGSQIFSLETGKVVGLHFAGLEGIANYCVTAKTLKGIINKIPQKILYSFGGAGKPVSDANDIIAEMVGRQCKLEPYKKVKIPSFKITGRMITYTSPDSTYAVTKKYFEKAEESILIGIYDFTAPHMVTCITEAIERGIKVSLMLDIDSEEERQVLKKLKKYGVECVPAPSCASKNVSYFSSSHEKVIVIDNKWTFIQSGNYSNNSIPPNESDGTGGTKFKKGNRDMGILIESKPLAKFFSNILRNDMQLELSAEGKELPDQILPDAEFLIETPKSIPDPLFPSRLFNFNDPVKIQPVLSPDNYMDEVPDLIASAKKSIKIEQQYIRVDQPLIKKLLGKIKKGIDVKIIVAPGISTGQVKTEAEVRELRTVYGFEVRLLSKKHFTHCHNKLIVVDNEKVLISSQNWSDSAVSKNREAGVIVYNKEITEYYSKIFDADWNMSDDSNEESVNMAYESIANLEAFATNPGKYMRMDVCDIQDV